MSLHNDIMDIQEKRLDSQFPDGISRVMYKEGHRDARHAAAELAIKADARIEALEAALQEIADGVFCDLRSVEEYARNVLTKLNKS
jgi:hypothetical protein